MVGGGGVRSKDQTEVLVGGITYEFPSSRIHVMPLSSPVIRTGNPPPKQAFRFTPISGPEDER